MNLEPVAHVRSPFGQKFGVPRQAGLVPVQSRIVFTAEYGRLEAFEGIESATHIWVIGGFHQARRRGSSLSVRPPRLGGNRRLGVFATRSSFRPNGLSLSAVKLLRCSKIPGGLELLVEGLDLVDGSPVFDVKPYLPYADCLPDATLDWASEAPASLEVRSSESAQIALHSIELSSPGFERSLRAVLALDPRPAYKSLRQADEAARETRDYALSFGGHKVMWNVSTDIRTGTDVIHITGIREED